GVHGVPPARRAVVVASSAEGVSHVTTLIDAGVEIAAVLVPKELESSVPTAVGEVFNGARVVRAIGRKHVREVEIRTADGSRRVISCDGLILSLGLSPRDGLLRMGDGVMGAGDVIQPGCSVE